MSNERTPLGIEGAPTTKASPVGIAILVFIIVLAVVAVYYYSPGLYEPEKEEQKITGIFNDAYLEQHVDLDGDEHYDYLNISVGVNVSESGKYSVDGSLYVGDSALHSSNTLSLPAGEQEIVLSFKGLNIYLQRFNSSYQLRNLTLRVIKGNTSSKLDSRTYAYNTSFYNYTDFQNSVHIEKKDEIAGSSSDVNNLTSDEYSFDVKATAAMITVRVDYDISKVGLRDSWIDLYIYYDEENESCKNKTGNENPKIITLDTGQIAGIGYGRWVALVHHCNDPNLINPTTANTAPYTLTIDVIYE